MADPEHIKLLLEGVDAWNERRKRENFVPNLEGINIPEEFGHGTTESLKYTILEILQGKFNDHVDLRGIDFSSAILKCADITNADLTGANLRSANLEGCNLGGAILENANLDFANLQGVNSGGCMVSLKGAKLFGVKLNGADLSQADLRDAIICEADLRCTEVVHADLRGANIAGTQLWKARLFSTDGQPASTWAPSKNMIYSIKCLLDMLEEIQNRHSGDVLYFRGEHCESWELQPSVMRDETLRNVEGEMLVDLMSRRPDEFSGLRSVLGQWVLSQHYGLKTRLLDITSNPLVALYHSADKCKGSNESGRIHIFAVPKILVKPFTSDTISIIANFAKLRQDEKDILLSKTKNDTDESVESFNPPYGFQTAMNRLYQFIKEEKPQFQERIDLKDLFRVFIVEPQQSFERIRTQSSAFIVSAFHKRFERAHILEWNNGIPIYCHYNIKVPKEYKNHIYNELRLFNITTETLFPGINEASEAVTKQYGG